jgi:photosystem II stability/assembly factor-like uncharacterized protein
MRWRLLGPMRAGRVSAVAGVPGDASTYYIGNPEGGVFKTTSGGTVWTPIFDHEPVSSIGAIAVAPSDPNIVYVGTGDVVNVGGAVNQGNGVYKSTDAGRTWRHLGLDDSRHISGIVVDPRHPDVVVVAALGHTYAANPMRGIYRSSDGGATWKQVLHTTDTAGAIDLVANATDARQLWAAFEPHAPGAPESDAAIFRSADEGLTWQPVSGGGLPPLRGRIGLAASGARVFAITSDGLYRSDDDGSLWSRTTTDRRIRGGGYFGKVYIAPGAPDTVYVLQTSMYRSTDGGATFAAYKGAPGGDDYHELWIDPSNNRRMILGVDQGVTISLNGGQQWSLGWYHLPNGQFYHITVDHRFPFWVYGTQQDSGSAAVRSMGDFGEITFMDWRPSVGAYEFGYIHPDWSDPNFVFATGGGTAFNRYNWTTRQIFDISPPAELDGMQLRYRGSPEAQSPRDPRRFFLGAQAVLATADRGLAWKVISPDLTGGGRAAISALDASPAGSLWAGTSDGRVWFSPDDGATWRAAAQLDLPANTPIESIAGSPLDPATAYATAERHIQNDFSPYVFRTTDGGAHWTRIVAGIPGDDLVRVVRADTEKRGLLFAGTERGVYVSGDDGARWAPLQLNLPLASVRDLQVYDNDLVAGTYGRGIWILDDLNPLRQPPPSGAAVLLPLAPAVRVQPNVNYDTPFPPEMAAGVNPPAGAILDYYLPQAGLQPTVTIYDAAGRKVRTLTSAPPPPAPAPQLDIPSYWLAPPPVLPSASGFNRFTWDLRYDSPPSFSHEYNIAAVAHATPADPRGPFVLPGEYTVVLAVNGHQYKQPLRVTMDPRVATPFAGLQQQLDLALAIAADMRATFVTGTPAARRLNARLGSLLTLIELSDDAPTATMQARFQALHAEVASAGGGSSR